MTAAPVLVTRPRMRGAMIVALVCAAFVLVLAGAPAAQAAPQPPDCPAGTTFDQQSLRCEGPQTVTCAVGSYDPYDERCSIAPAANPCSVGTYDPVSGCVTPASCASGYNDDGTCLGGEPPVCDVPGETPRSGSAADGCTGPAPELCPPDFQYDQFRTYCVGGPVTLGCPDGATHDGLEGVCSAAPLRPTSKGQCKQQGWRNYGARFASQGACIRAVRAPARAKR